MLAALKQRLARIKARVGASGVATGAALLLATASAPAMAQDAAPTFAGIFSDHAVLQRDRPIAVWGRAAPATTVVVDLAGERATATTDRQGDWRVSLPPRPAGGPYRLSVTSPAGTTTLDDIAIGDVFLCGGQSNMEFPTRLSTGAWGGLADTANPDLRFVTIEQDSARAPHRALKAAIAWHPVNPDTVGEASAVCYYMARSLQKRLAIPVGFIAADWGGTTIQSWISAPALRTLPAYRDRVDRVALFATDPARAQAAEAQRVEDWWTAHDPQARAQRAWIAAGYDDTAWPMVTPSGPWKEAGIAALAKFDGVVWYRTSVTLTAAEAKAGVELQLGPIDTYDSTWINGVRVGGSTIPWLWRNYPIPAGVLKAGRNVIAVRVLNDRSGGGLTGRPENRAIRLATGSAVPIGPVWRFHTGSTLSAPPILPSPWDVPTSLSTLYNGMIAPITGYGIKLIAWYQGEANVSDAAEYATLLPLLIADWRRQFGQPDLPFLVAQLSAYGAVATSPGESGWATLRDIQAKVVAADPHAGLAVTVDVGDRSDIHPTQKTIVGERLARAARAVGYGERINPGGPEAVAVERRGGDLVVRFRHVDQALKSYSADVAIGFEVCGTDTCRFVAGRPDGDTVVLPGADTPAATRVRYAWADAPYVNLYDGADLPVIPFEIAVPR